MAVLLGDQGFVITVSLFESVFGEMEAKNIKREGRLKGGKNEG
jgi:hypothetical protein